MGVEKNGYFSFEESNLGLFDHFLTKTGLSQLKIKWIIIFSYNKYKFVENLILHILMLNIVYISQNLKIIAKICAKKGFIS